MTRAADREKIANLEKQVKNLQRSDERTAARTKYIKGELDNGAYARALTGEFMQVPITPFGVAHPAMEFIRRALEAGEARAEQVTKTTAVDSLIGSIAPTNEKKLTALLDDLLTLEPQLKHHRKRVYPSIGKGSPSDFAWDFDRVHRAAEHIRNIDAAQSVGYTDAPAEHTVNVRVVN